MKYQEALAYIESTPKFTKKNKPENTAELIHRLGNPERNTKVIHVAGTNGKGSVCAFLSGMLTAAGYRTGLFTSPHLVELTERFQINGKQVQKERFANAFSQVMEAVRAMLADGFAHPAYFELLFATGLLLFAEEKVEYLVLETGLGGRLDATNLVERPAICVITSISLDHMEYLGNTVMAIAAEKAGILKPGVPVVFDARDPEAVAVIAARAKELGCAATPLLAEQIEITKATDKSIDFILDNRYDGLQRACVSFPAPYQSVNASLALLTLSVLDPDRRLDRQAALAALEKTRWPGRAEQVLPGVILDGAHNADGIREFIRTAQLVTKGEPAVLLFSAVVEKEYEAMIREICAGIRFSAVVTTEIAGSRMVPAGRLAEVFGRYTAAEVVSVEAIGEAFAVAVDKKGDDGLLFCVGSLYLIGELKRGIGHD